MSIGDIYRNKWVRLSFWAALYLLWVIWIGNPWWLLGLVVIFDHHITRKVKWTFWKKEYKEGEKHNVLLDWLDAIVYAVVVVTFINIFFLQAFRIPSSSMEKSLLTGDHLFVSKLAYGPKMPQTPLSVPFLNNVMPISGKESYSTAWQLPYKRIAGLGKVKRDDYVVFSFPHGDTVLKRAPADDYYLHVRTEGREYAIARYGPIVVRPTDKKDHYVKRCVALPGDTLQIIDSQVYVNGGAQEPYSGIQHTWRAVTDGTQISRKVLLDLGINISDLWYSRQLPGYPAIPLAESDVERVRALPNIVSLERNVDKASPDFPDAPVVLFPYTVTGWTRDNYGPLWIPSKGSTIELDEHNLALYGRCIGVYEGNDLEVREDGVYINGERAESYTFAMDYYFMMGDNRHNSSDSRYWGFVPEDHIVGKPLFIWLSTDANRKFPRNIRWNRFLKGCR